MTGPVAIVTGAASGIGAATAALLAERGVTVAGIDLVPPAAPTPLFRQADLTRPDSAREAVEWIAGRCGPIDMLVNSAGGGRGAPLDELDAGRWNALIALNLSSAFYMTQAVTRHMRAGSGSIVNVASLAARFVSPRGGVAYAAAKAGMVALSRQCAQELAPRRIRVNSVLPGPTRTALTRDSRRKDSDFPLGRWPEADDVARAIAFLLSDDAAMCTGAEIVVDGGAGLR